MMARFVVSVVIIAAMVALAALVVYPFVFTLIQGLFDNQDIGTIFGLAACVGVTFPLIWLTIGLIVAALVAFGVRDDNKRLKRERDYLRNRKFR